MAKHTEKMRAEHLRLIRCHDPKDLIGLEAELQMIVVLAAQQIAEGKMSPKEYAELKAHERKRLGIDQALAQCETVTAKPKARGSKSKVGDIAIEPEPFGLDAVLARTGMGSTRAIMNVGPHTWATIPNWRVAQANCMSAIERMDELSEAGCPVIQMPFRLEWNRDPEKECPKSFESVVNSLPTESKDKMPSCGRFGARFPKGGPWTVLGIMSGEMQITPGASSAPRAFLLCQINLKPYRRELTILKDTIDLALGMPTKERAKLLVRWDS